MQSVQRASPGASRNNRLSVTTTTLQQVRQVCFSFWFSAAVCAGDMAVAVVVFFLSLSHSLFLSLSPSVRLRDFESSRGLPGEGY